MNKLIQTSSGPSAGKPNGTSPKGSGGTRGNPRALGAGLTLAVTVGLFAYGGQWLDARLDTKPWLLLLGACCGIVGGMLHLIHVLAPELWPFGKLPKNDPPPPSE